MSDAQQLLGDTKEFHKRTVKVPISFTVIGKKTAFHFKILDRPAIQHYVNNYRIVRISGPIQFEASGPVSSTLASVAIIAICPDKYDTWPTELEQVNDLEGRVRVKDSLLVPVDLKSQGYSLEVSTSLKPRSVGDYPPVVVGFVSVASGTDTSETVITAHIELEVDGVGHRKTW